MDRRTSDSARFTGLFATHHAAVLAYAMRRVDASDAEDVVAEVFSTAWRHMDKIPDHPLPWLYRTAWNAIGNHRRSRARQARLTTRLTTTRAPQMNGQDPADASFIGTDLYGALARLRENDREAIRLVCWEQLSIRDSAAVLNCSDVAMKVRLHRARRRLANLLGEQPESAYRVPPPLDTAASLEQRS